MIFSGLKKWVFLTIIILQNGCKNDFELNAPYDRIPVVYGILDPSLEKQYFVIQRTFLGDGNANDYTTIEDSVLYNDVEAKLIWDNGNQSAPLTPEIIDDKDTDGLFFAPEQLVYSVISEVLDFQNNWDDNYQLSIRADDDTIYSETDVIFMTEGSLGLPFFNSLSLVNLNATPTNQVIYNVALLKFNSSKNALNHAVGFRLNYTEFYVGGDSEQKSFGSIIRTIRPIDDDGGEEMTISFFGESFYQRVRNNIPIDNNVTLRVVDQIQLVYSAYGRDLTRYVDFTNSTSNIGQESATYSNINDGVGLGIFSTRSKYIRIMQLSAQSLVELADGQYTADLKF